MILELSLTLASEFIFVRAKKEELRRPEIS